MYSKALDSMSTKRINQREEYTAHYARIERYISLIDAIFEQVSKDAVRLAKSVKFDDSKLFSFGRYPKLKTRVDELMDTMASDIQTVIINGVTAEWDESNVKNDSLTKSILGKKLSDQEISSEEFQKYFRGNDSALKAFIERKESGMNLSSRIWNMTKEYRSNLELALSVGLSEGKSAAELSRDIREYLNEPKRLFRRVRNKYGQLVLSKAAKSYNPGTGQYRSSYKNALRLARTEINMAYKTADYERWQQLDFVVGYEVKRSGRKYSCSICEAFAGKYPKWFKFVSWHPNCRCYVIPILMKDSEFWSESKTSVNEVSDVPDGFKKWCSDNLERAKESSSVPYWVRDNFKKGRLENGLRLAPE